MYAWIWRHLPGPRWLRAIQAAVLVVLVVAALVTWGYPWVATVVNENPTLQ